MTDRVHIPQTEPHPNPPDVVGTGAWWLDEDEALNLNCGGCGRHMGRALNHSVTVDGEINRSIGCPLPDCNWHVWGHLDGWTHGPKPAGAMTAAELREENTRLRRLVARLVTASEELAAEAPALLPGGGEDARAAVRAANQDAICELGFDTINELEAEWKEGKDG